MISQGSTHIYVSSHNFEISLGKLILCDLYASRALVRYATGCYVFRCSHAPKYVNLCMTEPLRAIEEDDGILKTTNQSPIIHFHYYRYPVASTYTQ